MSDPVIEGKPQSSSASEVKDDVVIIGGKERPLKNFVAELVEKTTDEVEKRFQKSQSSQPSSQGSEQGLPAKGSSSSDIERQIMQEAEREIEETGSLVPLKTIFKLIGQGTQYQVDRYSQTMKNSTKMIKEAKKELKSQYKDYSEYEDEFESIIEEIDPAVVTKDGLKIVFNSLRGQKLDAILEKERKAATAEAEKDRKIIGGPSQGTGSAGSKTNKLNEEQKKEMKDMGFDSEEDYLGRLSKRQELAKAKGAKNVPSTLAERLTF